MSADYPPPDPQIERATQETLQVIARIYERAIDAVWSDYPAPMHEPRHTARDGEHSHTWPTSDNY